MKKYLLKKEARIPFTADGYRKILEEKEKLDKSRPEAVENLRKAREMGDLSENGYYKAARARLSFLDAQIRRIERLVKLGVVVKSSGSDRVEIGSSVKFTDGENTLKYTVVGGYESDPEKSTISHNSPVGRALMGKAVNDRVSVITPMGQKIYTIVEIRNPGMN